MSKRSFPIFLLTVAFLISAWGNVISAAFCPRYLSNGNCESKQQPRQIQRVDEKSSCHQEMADMEMGDMQMDEKEVESGPAVQTSDSAILTTWPIEVGTKFSAEQVAITFPTETCGHCWMHSQPASGVASIVAVDPTKTLIDTSAPSPDLAISLPSAWLVPILQREHGPPGNSSPRHVLINVFRI
jgi:hypothetical protein